MVLSLGSALDHRQRLASVVCGFGKDLKEQSLAYMVGAGAGDEIPAWLQQLHSAEIDFLVSTLGCRNAVAILGEGGRIKNDHIETSTDFVIFLEQVERVGLAKGDI